MVMWTSQVERLDDGALLSSMAGGDRQAASVFVRRHQRAVYGLAITMCRDHRLAEDVSQQTFERVWKHAGSYDARRAPVRAWMLTITRRLCIDAFRTNHSAPVDPFDLIALLPAASGSVEDTGIARAEVRGLRDALLALPAEQQRVLLHASLGGRTAVEIAAIEQIPVGTVKTRLRLALAKVRSQVAPMVVDDV